MKTKITMLFFAAGLLLTVACTKYPPDSERVTEDLAIMTQYDVKADFNQYKTFAIGTTIVKITDKDKDSLFTNQLVQTCLAQITKDMESRGFRKYVSPEKPDLGISCVYYQNTNVYAYYPYYYWGYPYYGWGWYYPYYPTYYTSYTTGLFNIELVDLVNPAPGNKLYLRWNAGIRGLLNNNHTTSDVTGAIDQAFIQTPQLKTNHQ